MTRTYERVALTICALSMLTLAAAVVKKEFFPARSGVGVSFEIDIAPRVDDESWWSPKYGPEAWRRATYGPDSPGPRWTFGGAHSYTTRQLMGQRL